MVVDRGADACSPHSHASTASWILTDWFDWLYCFSNEDTTSSHSIELSDHADTLTTEQVQDVPVITQPQTTNLELVSLFPIVDKTTTHNAPQTVSTMYSQPPRPKRPAESMESDSEDEHYDWKDEVENDSSDEGAIDPNTLSIRGMRNGEGTLLSSLPLGKQWLLPPVPESLLGRKCLVLDLDETLVHSSFEFVSFADFVIPVQIDDKYTNAYVLKRPGVDEFLQAMSRIYEVVVFTASMRRYALPVLDKLDQGNNWIHHRLYRDSCYTNSNGTLVKNLAVLGRPLKKTIIIDNMPGSYAFHPHNGVPITSWEFDPDDQELQDMTPILTDLAKDFVSDVTLVLNTNSK